MRRLALQLEFDFVPHRHVVLVVVELSIYDLLDLEFVGVQEVRQLYDEIFHSVLLEGFVFGIRCE